MKGRPFPLHPVDPATVGRLENISSQPFTTREDAMCGSRSYFKNFCETAGTDCVCGQHAKSARRRRCLNGDCGKSFSSSCGAQLFCSLACQEQTEIGRQILAMVDRDKIRRAKEERRRRQMRSASQTYRQKERLAAESAEGGVRAGS